MRFAPLLVLALSLGITATFAWLSGRSERAAAAAHFNAQARETAFALEERIDTYVDVLVGGAALFSASDDVTAAEFRRYVQSLRVTERYPGIQGVGYSVRVRSLPGDSGATSDPPYRHTIVYIEPLDERNRSALGYDMFSEPVRRAALERARDTGMPTASGIVRLVQEIDADVQPGFLIYVPVYRDGAEPRTVAERRDRLRGFVYAPFRIHDLVRGVLGEESAIDLALYDGAAGDSSALLFTTTPDAPLDEAPFVTTVALDVEGRRWNAVVGGGRAAYDPFGLAMGRSALIAGVLISVLLFLLTRSMAISRERAQLAVAAHERSEQQYRVLFDGNPHPMWVYDIETLRFLAVNDAAVRHYGYSRAEFSRMSLGDIRPAEDRALMEESVRNRTSGFGVWRHLRSDGSVLLVEVTAEDVVFEERRARLALAHDVTERVRQERELEQARHRLTQILNLSNAVIYTMAVQDKTLVTTWVTENLVRLTGYTADEGLEPGWWYANLHPDDRGPVMATAEDLHEHGRRSIEYRFRRKDGRYIWIRDDAALRRDEAGTATELIGAWLDVSDRRRLEEQFQQAQKMEAVGRLAGGIAHDFNNILTIIRSQTDLLLMERLSESQTADIRVIQTAAERAAKLTSQLLAFGREQLLRPSVVDVAAVVHGMRTMLARIIGERVTIEHDLPEGVPPIEVDPGQLEQAILNLAVNARDAMPEAGVLRFSTRSEQLGAGATRPGDLPPGRYVVLSVTDTGVGMDEAVRARIFEPFFTTKPKGKGTGLGLAMVYGFVAQSGGAIVLTTAPGRGTTFDLYFPASAKALSAHETGTAEGPETHVFSDEVLLVEDDPNVARVARRILERAGFAVHHAPDAESALALIEQGRTFDVMLTDVGLPGMSGRHLVDELRRRGNPMPTVVMSGYAEGGEEMPGELPIDVEFVQKPFTADSLLAALRRSLAAV